MKAAPIALFLLAACAASSSGSVLSVAGNDTLVGNRPANLIVNGSFEADGGVAANLSYWATGTTLSPTMSLTGWTASGQPASYAYWGNDGFGGIKSSAPLPHGTNGVYFGAGIMAMVAPFPTEAADGQVTFSSTPAILPKPTDGPVTLEQTITGLNTSSTYLLDFWTSGENVGQPGLPVDGFFGLDITGESRLYFAAPSGNGPIGPSQRYQVYFKPTASTVTFKWINWGHYSSPGGLSDELVLDDVILNLVSNQVAAVDCNCLAKLPGLVTNGCPAYVPDLCALATNCFTTNMLPGSCVQNPPAGSLAGPGVNNIFLMVMDTQSNMVFCQVAFVVIPPPNPVLSLICASNKTVICGSGWMFDDPIVNTTCCDPFMTVNVASDITNGTCPQIITRTWQVTNSCGLSASCSQTVTVVDTTPPTTLCAGVNLVPNGNFEFHTACPSNGGQIGLAAPWFPATDGTCEYFSSCASSSYVAAPTNAVGNQAPLSGQGYAGILVYGTDPNVPGSSYREYIEVPLLSPLVAGQTYQVSFHVSRAEIYAAAIAEVGAYFSSGPIISNGYTGVLNFVPQVVNPSTNLLLSTTGWMLVQGTFVAAGGESYLTLGNFLPDAGTTVVPASGLYSNMTYYYFDDVSLETLCPATVTNKIVQCGTPWTFDPPTPFDQCSGTNVSVAVSDVTNGVCPQVITRTWTMTDLCANSSTWSQTVTVVNTNAVQLDCNCLLKSGLVPLTVYGCTSSIPDLCLAASACASGNCGFVSCSQSMPAGTVVGPGVYPITVTVYDCASNSASCTLTFTVIPPATPYTIICPPLNLSVTGCPPVMPSLSGLVTIVTNCAAGCSLSTTQTIPAGTALSPGQSYTVILHSCDCQGNCHDCDVVVNAVSGTHCCVSTFQSVLHSGAPALPAGAPDTQFLTGPPMFPASNPTVEASPQSAWIPNTALSQWVGPGGNPPGGMYYYTNRFFVCSTNQAKITGRWTADDAGAIYLNGQPTGNVLPGWYAFTNWWPVNITSGFVPGFNELVFAVTNYGWWSPTALRVETTASSCCSDCVAVTCPSNIVVTACGTNATVTFPDPIATTGCGTIVSVTCFPPSGSAFPVGTNVVQCAAVDSTGNAGWCSFTVTVLPNPRPLTITCPSDITLYTCGSNAIAYYRCRSSGPVDAVNCSPPSGSAFPLGTNIVTCIAVGPCGTVTCSFLVIVKSYLSGPPSLNYMGGLPDNFALPTEPAYTTPCMTSAMVPQGLTQWKGFDDTHIHQWFGHRFTGLPNNIDQAKFMIRMKPENNGWTGSTNDTFSSGEICVSPVAFWPILWIPGAGTWLPDHGPMTVTGMLPGYPGDPLLGLMNTYQHYDFVVKDDTTVDYIALQLWCCPPPNINPVGLPYTVATAIGTNAPSGLVYVPQPDLPAFGPIGQGSAVAVAPPNGDTTQPNAAEVRVGGGQAYGFTTILEMSAPEGAEIVISVPTQDGTNAPLFSIVKGKCPPKCNWDIKPLKKFWDDGGSACRVSAVNTNGDLLDSLTFSEAEAAGETLLSLAPEPGVDQFPVSFLYDATKGNITVTFPGSVARRLCGGLPCPKGWDGTIKGRISEDARRKGWDGTIKCPCYDDNSSRIVFTPASSPGQLLPASLVLSSTGLREVMISGEHLYTMGHGVSATQDGAVLFQGTAAGDGAVFTPLSDYTGLSLDLGRAASFDVGLHHFENGDIPTQEQFLRIGGPKWPPGTTTNRPPPPPIDLRLVQSAAGVACSASFGALGANSITISLLSNGVPVSTTSVPGPVMLPDDAVLLDHWPEHLRFVSASGVLSLTSAEPFSMAGATGDELRFTPELPPDATPFEFASELQCLAPAGMQSVLYGLQTKVAAAPAALSMTSGSTGTVISWPDTSYRLLGAETLDGPWIDLGVASPFVPPPNGGPRYFRLTCP
jgi:hypothetical protein